MNDEDYCARTVCVLTYSLFVCPHIPSVCVRVPAYLLCVCPHKPYVCVCVCVLKYCLCPEWHLDVRYLTRCVVLKQPNQMLRNTRVYLYKHNISISLCTSANTHTTYIHTHTHVSGMCLSIEYPTGVRLLARKALSLNRHAHCSPSSSCDWSETFHSLLR